MNRNEKILMHQHRMMEIESMDLLRYTCCWSNEGSTGTGEYPSLLVGVVRLHDLGRKRSLTTNGIRG